MKSLDLMENKTAKEEAHEQEKQEQRQTLIEAEAGEHLSEDFETVEAEPGRTFTQEELDRIIRERLAKVKEQYRQANAEMVNRLTEIESNLTEREVQLQEAKNRFSAERLMYESGYDPRDERILNLILGNTPEETEENFEGLQALISNPPEPRKIGDKKDVIREVMGLNGGRF